MVCLLLPVLPFLVCLLRVDQLLLDRDLLLVYWANKSLWAESMRSLGRVPQWNPFILSGTPYWAEANLAPNHPLNFVFLFFSPSHAILALKMFVLAHYPLIAGGAYYLFRAFQRPSVALLLTIFFAWAGFVASAFNLPHLLAGMAGTLFFFASWVRFVRNRNPFHFVGAAAGLTFSFLGGDPQFAYLSFLTLGLAVPFYARPRRKELAIATGILALLFFLLSAVQALPTISFLASSTRSSEYLIAEKLMRLSFHPMRLWEVLVPDFFGSLGPAGNYSGVPYLNGFERPLVLSYHLGVFPVALGAALLILQGARAWRRGRISPRGRKSFAIGGACVLLVWLSFGIFSPLPLYEFLLNYFPFWRFFRFPERLMIWFSFGLFFLLARDLRLLTYRRDLKLALFLAALAALPSLYLNARNSLWEQPADLVDPTHYPHIGALRELAAKVDVAAGEPFRFSNAKLSVLSRERLAQLPLDDSGKISMALFDSLAPNIGGVFGLYDVGGYLTLHSRDKDQIAQWAAGNEKVFDLFAAPFRLVRNVQGTVDVQNYTASSAPYFFLPKRLVLTAGVREAVQAALAPGFDLRQWAAIEAAAAPAFSQKGIEVRLERREPDRLFFSLRQELTDSLPFFFALNESFDPNWKLQWDGATIAPMRQNGWGLGFLVPRADTEGNYKFSVEYRNPWVATGKWVTLCTIMAVFLYLLGVMAQKKITSRRSRK